MGGVEKANIKMINNIDKSKFEVHVLYIKEGMLMDELTDEINILKLGSVLSLKSFANIQYIFKIMKYIKKYKIESDMQTITAGHGAIYACRNKDYFAFEPIQCHDSGMPVFYALKGKRAIANHDAIAYEKAG